MEASSFSSFSAVALFLMGKNGKCPDNAFQGMVTFVYNHVFQSAENVTLKCAML